MQTITSTGLRHYDGHVVTIVAHHHPGENFSDAATYVAAHWADLVAAQRTDWALPRHSEPYELLRMAQKDIDMAARIGRAQSVRCVGPGKPAEGVTLLPHHVQSLLQGRATRYQRAAEDQQHEADHRAAREELATCRADLTFWAGQADSWLGRAEDGDAAVAGMVKLRIVAPHIISMIDSLTAATETAETLAVLRAGLVAVHAAIQTAAPAQ